VTCFVHKAVRVPLGATLSVYLFQAIDLRAGIWVLIPVPAAPQCQVDRLPLHQPSPSANRASQGLAVDERGVPLLGWDAMRC
jgi:hypothetical protein